MGQKLKFTKMHGAGNDFIVIEDMKGNLTLTKDQVTGLCDRHFGIGADQILVIAPSKEADIKMLIYNADGDEVEMCGNGIRCVADYAYRNKIVSKKKMTIETLAGIIKPEMVSGGVRVDMGKPVTDGEQIPTLFQGEVVNQALILDGHSFEVTCVSMGNPHCVIFESALEAHELHHWGHRIEIHPQFPNRTNVEFVTVQSPDEIHVRVWERGSGETLACGTGACAAVVAGVLTGKTGRKVTVVLKGGTLAIEWDEKTGHVFMTGPSEEVFTGEIAI